MAKYEVFFELFGKKSKMVVDGDSRHNAIENLKDIVRDRIEIVKAEKKSNPKDDGGFPDFLRDIFSPS
jgi:hypothetical protein